MFCVKEAMRRYQQCHVVPCIYVRLFMKAKDFQPKGGVLGGKMVQPPQPKPKSFAHHQQDAFLRQANLTDELPDVEDAWLNGKTEEEIKEALELRERFGIGPAEPVVKPKVEAKVWMHLRWAVRIVGGLIWTSLMYVVWCTERLNGPFEWTRVSNGLGLNTDLRAKYPFLLMALVSASFVPAFTERSVIRALVWFVPPIATVLLNATLRISQFNDGRKVKGMEMLRSSTEPRPRLEAMRASLAAVLRDQSQAPAASAIVSYEIAAPTSKTKSRADLQETRKESALTTARTLGLLVVAKDIIGPETVSLPDLLMGNRGTTFVVVDRLDGSSVPALAQSLRVSLKRAVYDRIARTAELSDRRSDDWMIDSCLGQLRARSVFIVEDVRCPELWQRFVAAAEKQALGSVIIGTCATHVPVDHIERSLNINGLVDEVK